MNINDTISGFTVLREQNIEEIGAVLYEMEYKKTGTRLVWLRRDDKNKTFAITFKTIPSDDTGVFHILEHSVLNGSAKYPVKEPFVELLKGSLQTFLNAMTFADKTMYPVSSRNDTDFLNLIDVYMDAVLHPNIYTNENIFRQEGWHYELFDKESEPEYKGVVFNEMKGAYSSVETIMGASVSRLLFPDTCYGLESGGDPEHITDLTYEEFLDNHRRFYHPSNASIFLDGDIRLEEVFAKLDCFLSPYETSDPNICIALQPPVPYRELETEYEISPEEDPVGKTQLAAGYVYGTFDEKEKRFAFEVLSDVLCGSNESPLKKAILDRELAEDIYFQSADSALQLSVTLAVRNTDREKVPAIQACIRETIEDLVHNGIDRDLLTASFNNLEFRLRERDYGTFPRGLVYGISMMDSWLYGGDPSQYLIYDDVFAALRQKMDKGYFENLLEKILLDNPHQCLVILLPSATRGEKKRAAEALLLSEAKKSWSPERIGEIIRMNEELRSVQETPDTPEQLSTLPALAISDITEDPERLPLNVIEIDGTTTLRHDVETAGILYADLYFSIAGLNPDEIKAASFLANVLGEADTENYTSLRLQNQIKSELGHLTVSPEVFGKDNNPDSCAPYLVVSASALSSKADSLRRLVSEVANRSVFSDTQKLLNLLRQQKMQVEQDMVMSGHRYAMKRVEAYLSSEGAVGEYAGGLENYFWIKKTEAEFAEHAAELPELLSGLARRIFTRERLTISVTGKCDEEFISSLIREFSVTENVVPDTLVAPLGIRREGIVVPAGISFAVTGGNLLRLNIPYNGAMRVASKLLSLSYLWNVIRVQGGAYGSGFVARANGMAAFYSYRDPNAARSLPLYASADAFLSEFAEGDEDLTKFIIGTIADSEPLLSPRILGKSAAVQYLSGRTYEDSCRIRKEILATKKEDLLTIAGQIKAITETNAICVIGGKDKIDACGSLLSSLLTI